MSVNKMVITKYKVGEDKAHKMCTKNGACLSYFVSEKKVVPITVLLAFLLYIAIALVFYFQ